jgi:hypothetical protein
MALHTSQRDVVHSKIYIFVDQFFFKFVYFLKDTKLLLFVGSEIIKSMYSLLFQKNIKFNF